MTTDRTDPRAATPEGRELVTLPRVGHTTDCASQLATATGYPERQACDCDPRAAADAGGRMPAEQAGDVGLTYAGWGYEPGTYGATVSVFVTADGRVIGVADARYVPDEDSSESIEWDRVGTLPADCADLPWPPPRDLVLAPLTDDEQDDYYDELRDALREVLRD